MMKKKTKLLIMSGLFGGVVFLSGFLDGAFEGYEPFSSNAVLTVQKTFILPLEELSGLFYRPEDSSFYAVGDKKAHIIKGRLFRTEENSWDISSLQKIDFEKSLLDRYAPCQSPHIPECARLTKKLTGQWEGISAHKEDEIWLLHEQFMSIFVYSEKTQTIENIFTFPKIIPDGALKTRTRTWENRSNAMAEGMIVQDDETIWLAQERFPASVILMKKKNDHEFLPTQVWTLPSQWRSCDISELTKSPSGAIYFLSQECKSIAMMAEPNPQNHELEILAYWRLPQFLKKAESLIPLDDNFFLVGEDEPWQSHIYLLQK